MTGLTEKELAKLKDRLKDVFSDYEELAGGKNFRYHHLIAAHIYAREMVEAEGLVKEVDMRVLETAALFHDIGRSQDIEDGYLDPIAEHEGHDEKGAEIVAEFIDDVLEEEEVDKVEQIIRNHHSRPETVEGKIVQDADRLFKYGTQNIWRTFHYAYEDGRTLEESIEYFKEVEKARMEEKLEELHFDSARETAENRLEEQEKLYRRMERERKGEDI